MEGQIMTSSEFGWVLRSHLLAVSEWFLRAENCQQLTSGTKVTPYRHSKKHQPTQRSRRGAAVYPRPSLSIN
jgi:hypothetical protein